MTGRCTARRRARRAAALLAATFLTIVPFALAVPSSAAAPQPSLTVIGGGRHFFLQPGVPVHWTVGVTTHAVQLSSLVVRATATGPLARAGTVTLSLAGCTVPWDGQTCGAPLRPLIPVTPLNEVEGSAHPLGADRTIPAQASLLATVELDPAGQTIGRGQSAVVTIGVSAAGIAPPAGAQPTGSNGGPLATTGVGIAVSVLLGVLAVATGIALSGLARRHRTRGAQ